MRRPGREAFVGEASQGRRDVGLPWERRHRDVAMSDSREGGVTGTGGGRTSVTIPSGRVHTSALSVTEMPGTSHFPAPGGPFRAQIGGPETRCRPLVPYGGPKVDSASVCVGQHGRKRGVPDVSVTGSDLRHGSVSPPTHSRDAPVQVPPLPAHPPLSPRPQPARAVARGARPFPGASLRVPVPSRAPACGSPSLPGRQLAGPRPFPGDSLRAPVPSGRQLAGPRPFPLLVEPAAAELGGEALGEGVGWAEGGAVEGADGADAAQGGGEEEVVGVA